MTSFQVTHSAHEFHPKNPEIPQDLRISISGRLDQHQRVKICILFRRWGWTVAEISRRLGKTTAAINQALRTHEAEVSGDHAVCLREAEQIPTASEILEMAMLPITQDRFVSQSDASMDERILTNPLPDGEDSHQSNDGVVIQADPSGSESFFDDDFQPMQLDETTSPLCSSQRQLDPSSWLGNPHSHGRLRSADLIISAQFSKARVGPHEGAVGCHSDPCSLALVLQHPDLPLPFHISLRENGGHAPELHQESIFDIQHPTDTQFTATWFRHRYCQVRDEEIDLRGLLPGNGASLVSLSLIALRLRDEMHQLKNQYSQLGPLLNHVLAQLMGDSRGAYPFVPSLHGADEAALDSKSAVDTRRFVANWTASLLHFHRRFERPDASLSDLPPDGLQQLRDTFDRHLLMAGSVLKEMVLRSDSEPPSRREQDAAEPSDAAAEPTIGVIVEPVDPLVYASSRPQPIFISSEGVTLSARPPLTVVTVDRDNRHAELSQTPPERLLAPSRGRDVPREPQRLNGGSRWGWRGMFPRWRLRGLGRGWRLRGPTRGTGIPPRLSALWSNVFTFRWGPPSWSGWGRGDNRDRARVTPGPPPPSSPLSSCLKPLLSMDTNRADRNGPCWASGPTAQARCPELPPLGECWDLPAVCPRIVCVECDGVIPITFVLLSWLVWCVLLGFLAILVEKSFQLPLACVLAVSSVMAIGPLLCCFLRVRWGAREARSQHETPPNTFETPPNTFATPTNTFALVEMPVGAAFVSSELVHNTPRPPVTRQPTSQNSMMADAVV